VIQIHYQVMKSMKLEDTKAVIRSRKSKDRQYNGQKKKDRQWSTKHYTKKIKIELLLAWGIHEKNTLVLLLLLFVSN